MTGQRCKLLYDEHFLLTLLFYDHLSCRVVLSHRVTKYIIYTFKRLRWFINISFIIVIVRKTGLWLLIVGYYCSIDDVDDDVDDDDDDDDNEISVLSDR